MTAAVLWFGDSRDQEDSGPARRRFRVVRDPVPSRDGEVTPPTATVYRGRWAHLDEQAHAAAWLPRIARGDEHALEEMVRECYAPVASVALRYTASRELAEEVTQDLFMRIWERGGQIALAGSLMSYLFTAVRRRALNTRDSLRERAQHVPADTVLETQGSTDTPELLYDATELSQTLRAAVDRLPPRGREVFLLSRRDGLAPAQIAAALGISVQTVYTLLARALQELHKVMESMS